MEFCSKLFRSNFLFPSILAHDARRRLTPLSPAFTGVSLIPVTYSSLSLISSISLSPSNYLPPPIFVVLFFKDGVNIRRRIGKDKGAEELVSLLWDRPGSITKGLLQSHQEVGEKGVTVHAARFARIKQKELVRLRHAPEKIMLVIPLAESVRFCQADWSEGIPSENSSHLQLRSNHRS
jgi:hypothetical protein